MSENFTIGEIHRICMRIETQVNLQNGRVRKLEEEAARIKTIWTIGAVVAALGLDWLKHKLLGL